MSMIGRIVLAAAAGLAAAAVNEERSRKAERDNPPRGRLLDIDGVRLHVQEWGGGTPLLYLHGNGGMVQEVEGTGLIEPLARDHRVIVVDRPGFGHSDRPRSQPWTPERQADLFSRMLDQLDAAPAVVVGHSWGALVAAALAIRCPSQVRALVLISGYLYPTPRTDQAMAILALPGIGDGLRRTIAPLSAQLAAPAAISRVFSPNAVTRRFKQYYPVAMAVRPSQLRAVGEEHGLMIEAARRLATRYNEIACPTAILAGTADRIVDSQAHSVPLAREIEHASLRMIDGVGHMLPHVDPRAVLAAISDVERQADDSHEAADEPNGPDKPTPFTTH